MARWNTPSFLPAGKPGSEKFNQKLGKFGETIRKN
jgi:hypothetical protein